MSEQSPTLQAAHQKGWAVGSGAWVSQDRTSLTHPTGHLVLGFTCKNRCRTFHSSVLEPRPPGGLGTPGCPAGGGRVCVSDRCLGVTYSAGGEGREGHLEDHRSSAS